MKPFNRCEPKIHFPTIDGSSRHSTGATLAEHASLSGNLALDISPTPSATQSTLRATSRSQINPHSKPTPHTSSMAPLLQTVHLPHLPPSLAIYIAQYTSLRNAAFLHAQLLAGNPDFEYALIDASTILSPTHLLSAVFRACNDHLAQRMKSRNIHSEIVFALGYTNNIASTLKAFGISGGTTELIAVKIARAEEGPTREEVEKHLDEVVEGEGVEFGKEALRRLGGDLEVVRRLYKVSAIGAVGIGGGGKEGKMERRRRMKEEGGVGKGMNGVRVGEGGKDEEAERRELEMQVLGLMALRGAM